MYESLTNFEDLKSLVLQDKKAEGIDSGLRDRYPIRFVLLDDFRDCSEFVDFIQLDMGATVQSVEKWIDPEYPDLMITHNELADRIKSYIKKNSGNDCVIAPFSELARFYDNEKNKTFEALLKTIKAIEASPEGVEKHQRVYIPIVGLEGKVEPFIHDSQSFIWRLKKVNGSFTYRLILTDKTTYQVKGLTSHYTVVNNMREWLSVWREADKQVTPNIICTSHCIFANAGFAQPDNAFSFIICNDAYDFLVRGLQLQFNNIQKLDGEDEYWDWLAENIDITNGFNFGTFVTNYFTVNDIDSYQVFIKLWLDNNGKNERWLLARYYLMRNGEEDYISRILSRTSTFAGNSFFEQMAIDLPEDQTELNIRKYCLSKAVQRNVILRDAVQTEVAKRLENMASKYDEHSALKYFTGIANKEKDLAVVWLGKKLITKEELQPFFPDLYYYLSEPLGVMYNIPDWVAPYIEAYKEAKISDKLTDKVSELIQKHNASETTFDSWYQDFSTTRTLLQNRGDIEVYYWIDGLGVDWIPLIKQIINERRDQNIFLNEIKIARSLLPTTTSRNKLDLQKLLPEGQVLEKSGDIDKMAHQNTNVWPSNIVNETEKVREIIENILDRYNGKKIAIISDHGLTYLSQKCEGLGLTGIVPDHHGRIGYKENGKWTKDSNYIVLDDGKTACALKHNSLCDKVPKGQGIHGGCTPEEVLVPIFVISSYVSDAQWSAELLTIELSGADPYLKFKIKNLPSVDIPYITYDGKRYELHQQGCDIFISDAIIANENETLVSLHIGSLIRDFNFSVQTGAKEDDLFGDF